MLGSEKEKSVVVTSDPSFDKASAEEYNVSHKTPESVDVTDSATDQDRSVLSDDLSAFPSGEDCCTSSLNWQL